MMITPQGPPSGTRAGPENLGILPGIDLNQFQIWAQRELPGNPKLQRASLLSGGHSNLNFLPDFGDEIYVLRRPPLGHIMESAHNMEREYRALSALSTTPVPTPRTIALSQKSDPETGVDAPFFIMEFVTAVTLSARSDNEGRSAKALEEASHDLAISLATLHSLDPACCGTRLRNGHPR